MSFVSLGWKEFQVKSIFCIFLFNWWWILSQLIPFQLSILFVLHHPSLGLYLAFDSLQFLRDHRLIMTTIIIIAIAIIIINILVLCTRANNCAIKRQIWLLDGSQGKIKQNLWSSYLRYSSLTSRVKRNCLRKKNISEKTNNKWEINT